MNNFFPIKVRFENKFYLIRAFINWDNNEVYLLQVLDYTLINGKLINGYCEKICKWNIKLKSQ